MKFSKAVDQVIQRHLPELNKPGVLSVRPGYQAAGNWLTKKPAIVVNVDRKRDDLPQESRLPEMIEGYPVDVREPSEVEKVRITQPAKYALIANSIRPEMQPPIFDLERDFSGTPLAALHIAVEAARHVTKEQIDYTPPAGKRLDPITDEFTITCHASPDAGWPTLQPFLAGTKTSLTIGMYDFTSAHILEAFKAIAPSSGRRGSRDRTLNLVLDHPPLNKTHDQTDDDTRAALEAAFGENLKFAWALERNDPKVDTWIYPSAYHIKVVVRDSTAFWLSSGNFNNSNQPDIDPIKDLEEARPQLKSCDRDWHVIVSHPTLSALFEAFLLNDLEVAEANQGGTEGMDAFAAALAQQGVGPEIFMAARTPRQFFSPKIITDTMKIQPILTPDNYSPLILKLINSAETSFYMQTQYITPSDKAGNEGFTALIEAVASKIRDGLDVRLIFSQYETMAKLELLQDAGIDLSHVKIQANVHNKGMIVDSKVVAMGSQNWSGDGTLRNRDATLIIYNEEAAKYWQEIFIHDWTQMASQRALD
jgi:phosphatidylserine/phosphatidylglycerophosphate/cardiolipin synthase-like enzyme